MTVRTPSELKAQMPISQMSGPGKVYAIHIHDVVDTMASLTAKPVVTLTSSHSSTLSQSGTRYVFNATDPVTLTIPDDAQVGYEGAILQVGSGSVSILPGSLLAREGHNKTAGAGSLAYFMVYENPGNAPKIALAGDTASGDVPDEEETIFFKGFNYFSFWEGNWSGTWEGGSPDTIVHLKNDIGSNAINLVVTWFTDNATTSTNIVPNANSEPDSGVTIASNQARDAGMLVIIKPHVDCFDGTYRGNIIPADPAAWFASYKAHILRYATIAQNTMAYGLCVGTEMDGTATTAYRSYWIDLIDSVRAVFTGKILYAGDWGKIKDIAIWDLVDIIGIDAYVPLTTIAEPTVEQIVAGWNSVPAYPEWAHFVTNDMSPVDFYQSISTTYNKPVMFTELGYRNDGDAVKDPGLWGTASARNDELQARAYEAYTQVWGNMGSWFIGAMFWNCEVGTDVNTGANVDTKRFSPQNRLAETVISNFFKGIQP